MSGLTSDSYCRLTIDSVTCDYIELLCSFLIFVGQNVLHNSTLKLSAFRLYKSRSLALRSRQPPGVSIWSKGKTTGNTLLKNTLKEFWHLAMTHRHSCNPPYLSFRGKGATSGGKVREKGNVCGKQRESLTNSAT